MKSQRNNHQEVLIQLLPELIKANIKTIAQIRHAKAARSSSLPLNRDIKFLSRLNEIFAPVHTSQVKSNIPVTSDESFRNRASQNFQMIEQLTQVPIKGRNYLDIGCGRGFNIDEANRRKAKYAAGIDVGSNLAALWEKRAGNTEDMEFILDDLHTHDFQDKIFDVISSFNSLEHFNDPAIILRRCAEIIHEKGFLLISFNPLFHAPMGSHQYRVINIPYVQNIFDDDIVAEFFFNNKTKDPYPGLNRKKILEFDEILHTSEHWTPVLYQRMTDYRFAWMSTVFRSEFLKLTEDDLYFSGITTVLKRK